MIAIKHLEFIYLTGNLTRQVGVRDLSLSVAPQEIYGFLGKNGAGKTTAIKVLVGLLRLQKGEARILGRPVSEVEVRRRIGFLPENPYFYEYLTAVETMDFYGRLFRMPRAERRERTAKLLDRVGLGKVTRERVGLFSKGMRQRLGIAQALINQPELVVLDEPLTGLDPLGRRELKEIVLDLRREKKTVFFSSHILADAEAVCDRIGIIDEGRMVSETSLAEILSTSVTDVMLTVRGIPAEVMAGQEGVSLVADQGETLVFRVATPEEANRQSARVLQAGGSLISLEASRMTLEDFFLLRAGKEAKP